MGWRVGWGGVEGKPRTWRKTEISRQNKPRTWEKPKLQDTKRLVSFWFLILETPRRRPKAENRRAAHAAASRREGRDRSVVNREVTHRIEAATKKNTEKQKTMPSNNGWNIHHDCSKIAANASLRTSGLGVRLRQLASSFKRSCFSNQTCKGKSIWNVL